MKPKGTGSQGGSQEVPNVAKKSSQFHICPQNLAETAVDFRPAGNFCRTKGTEAQLLG